VILTHAASILNVKILMTIDTLALAYPHIEAILTPADANPSALTRMSAPLISVVSQLFVEIHAQVFVVAMPFAERLTISQLVNALREW
jgi:hypothetical protein